MGTRYKIGPLQLDPDAQVLTQEGEAVALGARAIAVLTVLVGRANEYVEKSAILDAAWPGLIVEEANLAVQISAIRRALARVGGEVWIETLARRGYRFVGPVAEIAGRSVAPALADRKRTNLPESLTSFIGRERELAEIKQRLPGLRLLTLTGTGGMGKTRLAQQAAAEMLDAYREGIWFIDLAPLADPALVPSALAQVLQVKESPAHSLLDALCNHLRTREILLIIDNCEHVLDGCARLIAALLRDTTQVTVIATSRELLHLPGEHAYPLGSLLLPDPAADARRIARSDAVQLFVERARQQRPRFDLQDGRARAVALICMRLDGIPLALELAAARVAALPVEEIVRLLDQRFRLLTRGNRELPRHQTLRAMIDWSYDLLDDAEKRLFARLSVFAGGWTLEAAGAVCSGEPIAKDDVVYVLIGLLEQSLVIADEDGDRYRMLETVRQHAREKLAESGCDEVARNRHCDYVLALVEEAEPKLTGGEQVEWLRRLDVEHDNIREALAWSSSKNGDALRGLRLVAAVWWFWLVRGHFREGLGWLRRTLDLPTPSEALRIRAQVLNGAGVLAHQLTDNKAAQILHEESLAIYRQLGERRDVGPVLGNLGNLARERGDYVAARGFHEENVAIACDLGDIWRLAVARSNLALVVYDQGNYAYARDMFEKALAAFRELADQRAIAKVLDNLGIIAHEQGDDAAARELHEESLALFRKLGDRWGVASALTNLGYVGSARNDHIHASTLFRESLAIRQDLGDQSGIAETLEGLAYTTFHLAGAQRAIAYWAVAERLREEIDAPIKPGKRSRYEQQVAEVRAAVTNDGVFEQAWREGRTMATQAAVAAIVQEK